MISSTCFFGLEFWRDLVTTILGALAGILLALLIDRKIEKGRKKEQSFQILKSIQAAFDRNLDLMKKIAHGSDIPSLFPSYSLDLMLLNAVSSKKYELITNIELLGKIDHAHYQFQHISRVIDGTFETDLRNDSKMMHQLHLKARTLCNENMQQIESVIYEIKNELEKCR